MNHSLYRRYVTELLLRAGMFLIGLVLALAVNLALFSFPVEGALVMGGVNLALGLATLLLESRTRVFLRRLAERDPRWADLLATAQEFARRPPSPFFQRQLAGMMDRLPRPDHVLPPPRGETRFLLALTLIAVALVRPARLQDDLLYTRERLTVFPAVPFEGERVEIRRRPPERVVLRVGQRVLRPVFRNGAAVYVFTPPGPGTYVLQGHRRHRLRVLPRPSLESVRLLAIPPAYTGLSPTFFRAGSRGYLPEGSTLRVVVNVQDTLWQAVTLQSDTQITLPCPCQDTLHLGTLEGDSLVLSWSLRGPRTFEAPPLVVLALPDRAPRVLVAPTFARADQVDTLIVRLGAVDDFGLAALLVREVSPWGTRREQRILSGTDWQGADTLVLTSRALLPGDTLIRVYRARDVSGKSSHPETLRVVYPDLAELAELPDAGDLQGPEEELERSREQLRRIREEILSRREVAPSTQEALTPLLQRQEEVIRSLEKRARTLEQTLEALSRLRELDPRLVQELREVAELLSQAMTEELRRALEEARKELARRPSPEAMSRALEALEKAQEQTLKRLQAFKALLQELKTFREMERLARDVARLREQEFKVESATLGQTPLDSLRARQAEIARQAARMKPRLPEPLKRQMDRALKAMEEAQTAMRRGDHLQANRKAREARKALEVLEQRLKQRMENRSRELAQETRKALEEARWRLLGFASFHAETTRVAPRVLDGVVGEVRKASPLLFFSAFRVWQALAQAVEALNRGSADAARRLVHLAILGLFDLQNQMAQQPSQGAQNLEQMVQQLLQGLRQTEQAMEGMMPLPVPIPREGQGTLEALIREMEALRRQAEALRQELGEGSPARDALGDLARALDENLRKLRSGRLSREDLERQKQATRKFLQALRAMHRKGFRERRRSTPGKPFTPVPPERKALDPILEVLRRQAMDETLPPSVREIYRRLLQAWTVPSS